MTALVVALAATCVVLGLLLVCALVGASSALGQMRTRLHRVEAENEDLTNELRHQARGSHPAGRGLSDTPTFAAHADIEPPGPEGGWATATINGHLYKARVAPVPVTEGEES